MSLSLQSLHLQMMERSREELISQKKQLEENLSRLEEGLSRLEGEISRLRHQIETGELLVECVFESRRAGQTTQYHYFFQMKFEEWWHQWDCLTVNCSYGRQTGTGGTRPDLGGITRGMQLPPKKVKQLLADERFHSPAQVKEFLVEKTEKPDLRVRVSVRED